MSRVVILGNGVSGQAVAQHFRSKGIEPIVLDEGEAFDFLPQDYVVRSPGIPPGHPWLQSAPGVIGAAELGLQQLQGRVLAVTGSNGKTTTVSLTAHVTGGLACGNIGLPIIAAPRSDLYVVELSSFQLHAIHGGAYLDAAVILNITPNHLDWHANFEEYALSKFNLMRCMKKGQCVKISSEMKRHFPSTSLQIFDENLEEIFGVEYRDEKFCVAAHDRQNIAAAWELCRQIGVSREHFLAKLATFKKPPHRFERLGCIAGVDYINDSKATSVDAVVKALSALKRPVHLIAGGVDKGGDFALWAHQPHLCSIVALGEARGRIGRELGEKLPVLFATSLEEAVKRARERAKPGESILFSPGCASFDQFRSFEERGESFKSIVKRGESL